MRIFGYFLLVWGVLSTISSIALGINALAGYLPPDEPFSLDLFILRVILSSVAPLTATYFIFKRFKSKKQIATEVAENKKKAIIEVKILQLAQERKGILSIAKIVKILKISSQDAQLVVDDLHVKGIFDIEVTNDGVMLYHLKNYISTEDRQTASSVI